MKVRGEAWIAGRLENPKSQHWHWSRHRKWAAGWREATAYLCKGMVDGPPEAPKRITFTAYVRRRFDQQDGLRVALSPILDGLQVAKAAVVRGGNVIKHAQPGAGVIHHDGPKCGHEILYSPQVVDRHREGVKIEVEVIGGAP